MRETPEQEICKFLHINQERLDLLKMQIAVDMRKAGACPEAFQA